jgi:hypothetical protein
VRPSGALEGGVRAALQALPLIEGADIAHWSAIIVDMVDQRAHAILSQDPTPSQVATELEAFASAAAKFSEAMQLSPQAIVALKDATRHLGITWPPPPSTRWQEPIWPVPGSEWPRLSEFKYAFARHPQLEVVARAAAQAQRAITGTRKPGAPRDDHALALAALLAAAFHSLTGRVPPKTKGESNRFVLFVGTIFELAGMEGKAAEHYARQGASLHRQRERGENVPEIAWRTRATKPKK